ncbi:MAG: hypothetical protein ACQERN_14690, partial [Thermodesulfobacteriota bacterium]
EKRNAKIVFWCASPFMFAGLLRLFFLFFYFIYGMILLWIAGGEYHLIILAMASATAVGFAVAVVLLLYRGFKRHVLGNDN